MIQQASIKVKPGSSKYNFDPELFFDELKPILLGLDQHKDFDEAYLVKLLKTHPKGGHGLFSKSEVISGFKRFKDQLRLTSEEADFISRVKKKPVRTISGVTPVTVLTKPFPCPGKCIFCPNDVRMPKSYLAKEPGAQRAARNAFDPYLQTYNRLKAFADNGHGVDKVELIILGGTWSFYPEPYQIWFIKRCFDAMNDFGAGQDRQSQVTREYDFVDLKETVVGSKMEQTYNMIVSKQLVRRQAGKLVTTREQATWEELEQAQRLNQSGKCRNVGLVVETRPDNISEAEVIRIRRLGATKTQIGFQSLSDRVLRLNHRGHDVQATRKAVRLLRQAGFKIHAHWMANLYGSSVPDDIADYKRLFSQLDFRPDELKIYPCSLIESAELMQYYQQGLWKPYSQSQLLEVVTKTIAATPEYCRLTRVIRDIPGDDIVDGNKVTNFRQLAEAYLDKHKTPRRDIRSREIKAVKVAPDSLKLKQTRYTTSVSQEYFLQYVTDDNQIVAFLRLSLPKIKPFIAELANSAIIREVHVYGVALDIGSSSSTHSQHLGLGQSLISRSKLIARRRGYQSLAVISAIGTREYYAKLGFTQGELYQHLDLRYNPATVA